ncbi:MAG: ATP-binding cassette domain-containing protein [Candidatus Eremiobacteraeota bacterium]|nr:ATP-binding cassette domain-containing protein [Candidatus Eremiobacteraeota bacterium]
MLTFEGVTGRYGTRTALDDATFSIRPGERVALVGPSGAGKTTIFRLAYGAFAPVRGRVSVGGADLATLHGARLRATRARIAVIFQAHGLVERLRVWQNVLAGTFGRRTTLDSVRAVLLPRPAELELVRDALARVGLADRIRSRSFELSGGQRQRVAIARAIAQQAELVLADEPAASLDPELGSEIVDMLLADARDRRATLLCSLHQPELARRFDRVIRVDAGRLSGEREPPG